MPDEREEIVDQAQHNVGVERQHVFISRNLNIAIFEPEDEGNNNSKAWKNWLTDFQRQCRYFRIVDAMGKKDALLIYGGTSIRTLDESLKDVTALPADHEQGEVLDDYTKCKYKLVSYFASKRNTHHSTYLINMMRPEQKNPTMAYAARLRAQAKECDFGQVEDARILEHIIQTVSNKVLVKKAISKKWTLDRYLSEAAETEDIEKQVLEMGGTTDSPKYSRSIIAIAASTKSQKPRKRSIQQASRVSTAGVAHTHQAKTVQHTGNGVENAISRIILSQCVKPSKTQLEGITATSPGSAGTRRSM